MKRKNYTTDFEAAQKFKELKRNPVEGDFIDDIKKMISRRIDKKVTLEGRKDTFVQFYCPFKFVLHTLGDSIPIAKERLYYSNLESKYVECLEIEWQIDSYDYAMNVFGERAFRTRNYSDSKGRINL